jgi:hypothetical protein
LLQQLNNVKNTILINKKKQANDIILNIGDLICDTCRVYARKYGQTALSTTSITTSQALPGISRNIQNIQQREVKSDSINEITINIPRAISSTRSCVVCNKTKNLVDVPDTAYVHTFITKNVLIPHGDKCCPNHLNSKNTFHKKDLDKMEVVCNQTVLNNDDTKLLLDRIRHLTTYST